MFMRLSVLLILLLAGNLAMAQNVYRWTDERGEVHYGHSVPPEHAHRGYDRLGRDGSVRQSVAPSLTPEERAERSARMAQEAETEAERRDQENRDRMLLSAYRSVDDIMETMAMQLASVEADRRRINNALSSAMRRFENQIARAAQHSREGQDVPEQLTQSIHETRSETRQLRRQLDRLDQREDTIRGQYEAEAERFRELASAQER